MRSGCAAAGAGCRRSTTLPWPRGEKRSHTIAPAEAAMPNAASAPRQPNQASAIGTATIAARNEPSWMPVVYTPVSEQGPRLESSLDGERHQRVPERHSDAHRHRREQHERGARRDRPRDARDRDEDQRCGDGARRADACGEQRGRRGEQPHAEHRDRHEQARDRVRDAQAVLDVRQERPDADELRPQRDRAEPHRDEQPCLSTALHATEGNGTRRERPPTSPRCVILPEAKS